MAVNPSTRAELHREVETGILVAVDDLTIMVKSIFIALGLPSDDADCATQALIYADARGIDSHGVSTVFPRYVNYFLKKSLNPCPSITVHNGNFEMASYIEADNALGTIALKKAVDIAIKKGQKHGMSVVAVRNAGHAGAIGYQALQATKYDMIGLVMAAGKGLMVPPFGRSPLLGTNPIAFAAPAKKMPPFVFDAATTAVCGNKIRLAEILDIPIPSGWIFSDSKHENNSNKSKYFEDSLPSLLPLGSSYDLGSHKGFGLGMMIEILSNTLCSSLSFTETNQNSIGHFAAVFRTDLFGSADNFKTRMDDLLQAVINSPSIEEDYRVLYAGARAYEKEQHRRKYGIPLQPSTLKWFHDIASYLNITCNLPLPV
jgi:LDH2 family malate/lactate/ureidoglycolate dehydrogenase